MRKSILCGAVFAMSLAAAGTANAACYTKYAKATSETAESAKWYVLETIVQAVDWGAWPAYVSTGKPAGYTITSQRYSCKPNGGQVTCNGAATLCKQ